MKQATCKNCVERGFNCHAHCNRYAEYQKYRHELASNERINGLLHSGSYTRLKAHDKYIIERQNGRRH